MATKDKGDDIMDSVNYAKDVLKSDGGMMASKAGSDMLIRITGSELGKRGGLIGAQLGASRLLEKIRKPKKK